ncbi:MAG: DUF3862 domain-containing protein [Epulopiscium sp.]|nr:DUF3862 domain-containing protein [Candidatus Epulonipiscium sp.]
MAKFCTKCGKPLQDGTAFCGECGQDVNSIDEQQIEEMKEKSIDKRAKKGRGCLIPILCIVLIPIATVIFMSAQNSAIQRNISGVSNESEYITMDEYNKIQSGMTYEQVCEIVGSAGEISAESNVGGYSTKIITWYGNGAAGSNANVTFMNNEVQSKAQAGLK